MKFCHINKSLVCLQIKAKEGRHIRIISKTYRSEKCFFHIILVVTGSSEGIGLAYAKELARRGLNVVLISRGENKLYRAAKDIGTAH